MGLGKFLLGGVCAVGAVIAAPVVAPIALAAGATVAGAAAAAGTAAVGAAAAAGTAAAGAAAGVAAAAGTAAAGAAAGVAAAGTAAAGVAAAAGTAVVGAAAAAGTAVAGTAAAAGTALASTAVGGAVTGAATAVGGAATGAMMSVGTAVGSAAGAVGLAPIAKIAGGEVGAIALGKIVSSATVGAVGAASGAGKIKEANETKELAERRYNRAREEFDRIEASVNNELENLGRLKLEIWADFQRFVDAYRNIKNIEDVGELELDEALSLDKNELGEVTVLAIRASDLMIGGIASVAGGNLIGLATSAGITSLGSASTGAAIGTLHGAAATNATLAALGGGALKAGGLGMKAGAVVAKGLSFAPMLAIGGVFLHSKGKKSLEDAKATEEEVDKLIIQLEEGEKELCKLEELSLTVSGELYKYKDIYDKKVSWLEGLVKEDADFSHYTKEEKYGILVTGQIASILKDLTLAKLLPEAAENQRVHIETEKIEKTIKDCDEKWRRLAVC